MNRMSPLLSALVECVSLPTPQPPGDTGPVCDWLEAWARRFGADVVRQTVESGRDNLLITLDFGPGPSLLFNSHMDVNSPAGQKWERDPFTPSVVGSRLYGVGSADTKGSLTAMLYAMERIAAQPARLKGKITLSAVMGEEAGGLGSLFLVRHGIAADGAVVGEPTGLEVAVAHKGTYMRKVRFQGCAAHSGSPQLGINAILHAAAFCLEYDKLNEHFRRQPNPYLGPANASVTLISGGTRQNTIPESAEVLVDRRLIPGETHENADRELEAIIGKMEKTVPHFHVSSVKTVVSTIPSQTPERAKIVQVALQSAGEVLRREKKPVGFSAGCDMSKLVTMAGIPTVILGPGSLHEAHSPNEFVEIVQVEQAAAIYERIGRKFLEEAKS